MWASKGRRKLVNKINILHVTVAEGVEVARYSLAENQDIVTGWQGDGAGMQSPKQLAEYWKALWALSDIPPLCGSELISGSSSRLVHRASNELGMAGNDLWYRDKSTARARGDPPLA
jgi:hypothetical protein